MKRMNGQQLHDKLRADLPEGATCITDCPFCADKPEVASHEEEKVSDKVFDQEAVDALLDSARSKAAEEAKAESEDRIAELEAEVAEKDKALDTANAKIEALKASAEEAEESARLETLADERASQVGDVANFSEEYIEDRKAAWAEQSDDEFAQTLKDFEEAVESAGKKTQTKPPDSKLNSTRETAGEEGSELAALGSYLSAAAN
jgi:hypothetical protein